MQIRLAEERDRQWLIREYLEQMSPDLEQATRHAERCLHVDRALLLEQDFFPLGVLHWGIRSGIRTGVAEIVWLRVIPTRRGKGHGRSLLERALEDMERVYEAHGMALRSVMSLVPEECGEMLSLLQSCGFARAANVCGLRGAGSTDVLVVKRKETSARSYT